ncbi:uncharacterized protein O3Q21_015511 [Podargus strigoides]
MPVEEKANARSQPSKGLPSLQERRHQTDSRARSVALTRSSVKGKERQAVAPGHRPTRQTPGAPSTCRKLPSHAAAPSAASARGREMATVTVDSSHQQPVPSARGVRGQRGTGARLVRSDPHCPAASAAAVRRTAQDLKSDVRGKAVTGGQGPSQQPAAQRDRARSKAVVTASRTDGVQAGDGGKAPTAQLTPHPCARAGTGSADRAPEPASSGRDARPRQLQQQEVEEQPSSLTWWQRLSRPKQTDSRARSVALTRSSVKGKRQAAAPGHRPTQQTPGAASTCCKLPSHPAALPAASGRGREMATGTAASGHQQLVPSARGICGQRGTDARVERPHPRTGRSLAQSVIIYEIWLSPLFPQLLQGSNAGFWEGLSWPRCTRTVVAGEAAGHLQSSPALTGLTGAELAASALPRAPEEEEHCLPNSITEQEETKTTASPFLGEPVTTSQAESQAPARHSPTEDAEALQAAAAAQCILREIAGKAVAVTQGPSKPAAAAESQAPARHSPTEDAEALQAAAAAQCILREIAGKAVAVTQGPSKPAAAAESQAPARHSPTEDAEALQAADLLTVCEVIGKAAPVIQREQQDLAQSTDVDTAARTPAAHQDAESSLVGKPQGEASRAPLVTAACEDGESTASPMSGNHQAEGSTAIVSLAAHKHKVASSLPRIPPADAGTPHPDPAADDEGDSVVSPSAQEPQHQVASEHREDAQCSSSHRDHLPKDDPGIAALPHVPARRRRPSLFRRALRALRRAFRFTCAAGHQEQQHPTASARRVPRGGRWP